MLPLKKDNIIPIILAGAVVVLALITFFKLPRISLMGVDLKLAVVAGLGFLAFKVYRWSQNLFAEIPS